MHSTGTISLFSDFYRLQVLFLMPSNFAFNRCQLGVQKCSEGSSSGQTSSYYTPELELNNLFLKQKCLSTNLISFIVVNVLNNTASIYQIALFKLLRFFQVHAYLYTVVYYTEAIPNIDEFLCRFNYKLNCLCAL